MGNEQDVDCEAMARKAPQHDLFKAFAGTFRAEVRMWMGPGDPMVMTGSMVNRLDLDGRFLIQDYKGDPSEGPFPAFEGRGFWGYNTATEQFEGVWIDNASTMMQFETGSVDSAGKNWEIHGEMSMPGTDVKMKKRSVIRLQDNDRHSMEMYFTGADGKEQKNMEIHYTRKS